MNLLYLDESGDPYGWQKQKCYVIGGVAVHEGQIHGISERVEALQTKYFPGIRIPISFHASEIRRGKGHFEGFQPGIRYQMLQDLYELIEKNTFPNLVVFATAIDISAVENPTQALKDVFEDICEKFNAFLIHRFQRGSPTKGLLIIDQNRESEYRELVNNFKKEGTTHGYLGNLVDIPYFARCHQTRMLQLADLVANAVYEYYEHGNDTYLKIILPRFYGGPLSHLYWGFGHITAEQCDCVACCNKRVPNVTEY